MKIPGIRRPKSRVFGTRRKSSKVPGVSPIKISGKGKKLFGPDKTFRVLYGMPRRRII